MHRRTWSSSVVNVLDIGLLAARWNRLDKTVKTRKTREKAGRKWPRYGLTRVNKAGTGGINWLEQRTWSSSVVNVRT